MRETLLVLVSLIAWSFPVAGQVAPRGPVASVVLLDVARGPLLVDWSVAPRDSVVRDIRPTYWKEGLLVGGLVGAVGGLLLGAGFCEMEGAGTGCMTAAILGGGVLLLLPGALIGGQFEKGGEGKDSSSD